MKRIYNITKIFSFSYGKFLVGLWTWNEKFYWRQLLIPGHTSMLYNSWQFQYFKCSIYKKIEIQWLYHYYFQIIIDK